MEFARTLEPKAGDEAIVQQDVESEIQIDLNSSTSITKNHQTDVCDSLLTSENIRDQSLKLKERECQFHEYNTNEDSVTTIARTHIQNMDIEDLTIDMIEPTKMTFQQLLMNNELLTSTSNARSIFQQLSMPKQTIAAQEIRKDSTNRRMLEKGQNDFPSVNCNEDLLEISTNKGEIISAGLKQSVDLVEETVHRHDSTSNSLTSCRMTYQDLLSTCSIEETFHGETSNERLNEDEENNYNDIVIPQELIPEIGKTFNTLEEAQQSYNTYAQYKGFSTRKMSHKMNKKGKKTYQRFSCSKEGKERKKKKIKTTTPPSDDEEESIRESLVRRTQCKAGINVRLSESKQWVVTKFTEEHNHEMAPPKMAHYLRSHRHVADEMIALMEHFDTANIEHSKQVRIIQSQSGGTVSSMGCIPKDLENAKRKNKVILNEHDAELLEIYLEAEKKKNPSYLFTIDKDEEGKLTRCFWCDATSRRSYGYFGDCLIVDATYKTNKYHMISVTIAGVNHHRQTIVFGSALILEEKVETYEWILQTWLDAMPSKVHPKVIITDQDASIAKAITVVLPNTFHRLCIWHITMKFQKKFSPQWLKEYHSMFKKAIWNSNTTTEFDTEWKNAMSVSGTIEHVWLVGLFNIRNKWVPSYCKQYFAAGMSSSQRIESNHAFFKKYICERNTLLDFIIRFTAALNSQREKEIKSDYDDIDTRPKLKTLYDVERQMRDIYTIKMFQRFQNELFHSQPYMSITIMEENFQQIVFSVSTSDPESIKVVVYNKSTSQTKCSCQMYEFDGIPCRHILFFLRTQQQPKLPDIYIMPRWTKNAKKNKIWDEEMEISDEVNKNLILRHMNLSHLANSVAEKACISEASTSFARQELQLLIDKLVTMSKQTNLSAASSQSTSHISIEGSGLKNPRNAKTKGSGKHGSQKRAADLYYKPTVSIAKSKKLKRTAYC